jgi:ferredoxin-nitrite reductase
MNEQKINKIEKLKRQLKPCDYYERLSTLDPSKLEESDRFYLKNFGIYNHKLDPDRFAVRVRIPAGRIRVERLKGLHAHARSVGASVVVTSRAQLELHGLDFPAALETLRVVEDLGMTSWQTFTDNFRNIVTDPLDGIAEDNVIETYGLVLEMQEIFLKNPDFVGMIPRKFNTAISGSRLQSTSFFGNDLFFALARRDGVAGFNLYAGGKNSETARPLDIFAAPSDVVDLFRAAAEVYRREGPRESRSRARLFHLIDRIGIEALRGRIVEACGRDVGPAGELQIGKGGEGRSRRLKNGRWAHRYTTWFGETDERHFEEMFALCDRYGIGEIRIGCDQNFYIPDLPEDTLFEHAAERYEGIVACAGSKYCVYSLMDTKGASADMGVEKCRKHGISIGFSGCLKGCARHAFSDIGLVGIRTKLFAKEVERGIRLYLGAEYTRGKRAARLILYAVPMRRLNAMIDLIADLFEASGYDDFEDFSREILNRYSEPALAFWLLLNFYRRHVAREGELLIPEAADPADEKRYFIDRLLASGSERDRDIVEYLECQEAFPFREAIIFLERACFKAVRDE